jgi:hypothetical protein
MEVHGVVPGTLPETQSAPAAGVAESGPGVIDLASTNGASAPSASVEALETVEPTTTDDRIASLEGEISDWQRRAVMWRERALSAQALNEALSDHVQDLQGVLRLRMGGDTDGGDAGPAAAVAREPIEQWWMRVFRRDTWKADR